jgi:hypothetical protein
MGIVDREPVHIGYSVEDIDSTVTHLVETFGAGPFYKLEDLTFDELEHAGEPAVFEHSTAFGRLGSLTVELWEVHALEPAEALGPRFAPRNQINHLSFCVEDPIAEGERLAELGCPELLWGRVGEIELKLHDVPRLGHLVEIEPETDQTQVFTEAIVAAARDWDGSRPLRDIREVLPDL